jgi:polysaccharide biosynthesis protein PslF
MMASHPEAGRRGLPHVHTDQITVAYLSTYPPRECGLATFCEDTIRATNASGDFGEPMVVAMESGTRYHQYARPVVQVVDDRREADYAAAADFINDSRADVVSLQHEFGIYGGAEGRGLYAFLNRLRKPLVTTLHTVLPSPDPHQLAMVRALGEHSDRLVVMNPLANLILHRAYQVPPRKLTFMHHGAPAPRLEPRGSVKSRLGLAGRKVMCTFGLVGPGKGLEHAIAALPAVVARHPNLLYLIVGQTHPGACREGVDEYREALGRQIEALGVTPFVRFVNHYLTKAEIVDYLAATDIYITPYLNPHQICSGTLAYAVASGRAIISTPYLHARFLLARERGVLVDFSDPSSIAAAVRRLLETPGLQGQLEARARVYGQRLLWTEVGSRYRTLLREVVAPRVRPAHGVQRAPTPQPSPRHAYR